MGRFDGKVAIITGASGGIGQATAILFAREGAQLMLTGRNAQNLARTKTECMRVGARDRDVLELLGDITVESVQDELIGETVEQFGKLDILVNNHGGGEFERDEDGNLRMAVYDSVMNTNFKSKYMLALKAIPYLKQSRGDIVMMSSISSRIADPHLPFYSLASACVDHATKLLAFEYASSGVRVNALNPSVVDTPAYEKFGLPKQQASKLKQHIAKTSIPLGEVTTPENIAEIIAFLADRRASKCITGQSISADGGATLQIAMADYENIDVLRALNS
uniref:Uncharacterized protein n=1 Tax=Parascaris univalens TaxID=6257 RepID=A0A915AZA5_PARUN